MFVIGIGEKDVTIVIGHYRIELIVGMEMKPERVNPTNDGSEDEELRDSQNKNSSVIFLRPLSIIHIYFTEADRNDSVGRLSYTSLYIY